MVARGVAAAIFAIAVTVVQEAHSALKTSFLPLSSWILIALLSVLGSFWKEGLKLLIFDRAAEKRNVSEGQQPGKS